MTGSLLLKAGHTRRAYVYRASHAFEQSCVSCQGWRSLQLQHDMQPHLSTGSPCTLVGQGVGGRVTLSLSHIAVCRDGHF